MATGACPRCGADNREMRPVDTGMKVALTTAGETSIPSVVCVNCYGDLSSLVSQGMRLRIEKENREKNKLMLWKNRTNLIRVARNLMAQKSYSEAAVNYEKYLRVLEMVYNLKNGELSPDVFSNSKRSKELTVVTTVYWDLMRIYDTSPRYGDRMSKSAMKLAQFLPLSTIYPDVIRKAEAFSRSAKNPAVVRSFLKACKTGRSGCFIATAVFEDSQTPELQIFRAFRDELLLPSATGRAFVEFYYRFSPPLARLVGRQKPLRHCLKPVFRLLAKVVKKSLNSRPESFHS